MTNTTTPRSTTPGAGPTAPTLVAAYVGLLLSGAIFGVFYAWFSTVMWGFDAADPRIAIAAMQAANAEIRNAAFFPSFFLTPVALAIPGFMLLRQGFKRAAYLFLAGAVVYLLGGLILTMAVNVPMNEDLATVIAPESIDEARIIWDDYSGPWQFWNLMRTIFSGLAMLLGAVGLGTLARR